MKKTVLLSGFLMLGAAALPAHAQQTVTFVGYSGLFQERYTKAVIEPFMAATRTSRSNIFRSRVPLRCSARCAPRKPHRSPMSS